MFAVLYALLVIPLLFAADGTEKPRHSLPPQYVEIAEPADYEVARFMQDNCKDVEKAILYVPRTRMTVSVGDNATIGSVHFDNKSMHKTLRSESEIIEAHCHIGNLETIAKAVEDEKTDFEKILAQVGSREMRERFWFEVPSPGDIFNAIHIESMVFAKHPKASVKHIVVVLEPGLPPHVLRFGLTEESDDNLRKLVKTKKYGNGGMTMLEYGDKYASLRELDMNRCEPFTIKPSCRVTPAREAIEVINTGKTFFVRDRGYLNLKEYFETAK